MVNWSKLAVGTAIFTGGLVMEPTPLMEMAGLAIIASSLGVKIPGLGK
jgi:hypothetical protein